ncbi:MAG: hypothetical protein LBW85_01215 [Deltaproteobacteria bacterium]|jgi:hypothetical protein|nr:hypothetical protein [Deltaproteobacteria bacterium]
MKELEEITRHADMIGRILSMYARPETEIADWYMRHDARGREAVFMGLLSRLLLERARPSSGPSRLGG